MPPPSPPAPRSILTAWQRPVVRFLLWGTVLVGATGAYLWVTPAGSPSAAGAFIAHVLVGALLVPVLLVFTIPHAIAQTRRKPFIALSGAFVLMAALAAIGSGGYLTLDPLGSARALNWWVHVASGIAIFLLYVLHRRFGSNPARWVVLGGAFAATAGLAAAFWGWERVDPGHVSIFDTASAEAADASRSHFLPSSATSGAGDLVLTAKDLRDVSRCGTCHRQITQEWKRSAHRHASMTNDFYRASVEDLRNRFPKADARWCAGCHDPALLFSKDPASDLPLIASETLDFKSEDARTGITCIVCHAMDPKSTLGNADYEMRGRKQYPGEHSENAAVREAHDVLLRLKPKAHVDSLTPSNLRKSAYCSVCHKAEPPVELTRWHYVRAQDEYDAHDDSGVSMGNARSFYHPPAAKSCQDCHMPLVADPDDPAADAKGMVKSHLFAAANTALPHLRGDVDMIQKTSKFLQTACRLDVTAVVLSGGRRFVPARVAKPAVKPGEVVEADVVVRNLGVGHNFPGGTSDSNEVWIDFQASVDGKPAFYASGLVDPVTGEVDPSAEFYRSYWLRRDGTRFVSRVANDLYTQLYIRRIGPGTADVVRYRFRVPEGASGTLDLKATLRYRKFMLPFVETVVKTRNRAEGQKIDGLKIEHQLEQDYLVPGKAYVADFRELPIVDMTSTSLTLPVTSSGTEGPAPAPETLKLTLPDDREKINDLAIALLLQTEFDGARDLFTTVTKVDPKYADGYVNVARAAIAKLDWPLANSYIDQALAIKPGLPKALFFRGMVRRNSGDFAAAQRLFEQVLEAFPRDRESYRKLADVLYQQDKLDECLAVVDRYMKIEPEDWEAWYWAMRCWQDKGDAAKYEAAKAAHDRFRPDDDRINRAGLPALEDPNIHNLAQPVHAHEQPGLKGR